MTAIDEMKLVGWVLNPRVKTYRRTNAWVENPPYAIVAAFSEDGR